ncbi:hypothetical protein DCE93_09310 [Agromyces badenianii]|uniref:Uncharacterized protein n=1 Tax=Agromyces badenianii TaxID=2080742 RepID=A0A2S0WXA4_9MICO|nr:hypothetical protein [Agromyces badenianii]AWB95834.1 hypothetical protein DCE93_09310 [Agromyces badenianii]PWC03877.1 hypothetical protein DCE94_06660 [Agromyces badenianii]
MFRRWRRARLAAQASAHAAAPTPRPSAADLRGEHIFELLNARLSEFIGPGGGWSLVRKSDGDTDRIFHAMLTHQIASELTRAILDERDSVAVVVPAGEETLALGWEPAPLIVWADPVEAAAPVDEPVAEASSEVEAADLPTIGAATALEARAA